MVTTLLMIIILFASVAMLYNDGMWSNAIRLINVVTAALLAMNFYEPLAELVGVAGAVVHVFLGFPRLVGIVHHFFHNLSLVNR